LEQGRAGGGEASGGANVQKPPPKRVPPPKRKAPALVPSRAPPKRLKRRRDVDCDDEEARAIAADPARFRALYQKEQAAAAAAEPCVELEVPSHKRATPSTRRRLCDCVCSIARESTTLTRDSR